MNPRRKRCRPIQSDIQNEALQRQNWFREMSSALELQDQGLEDLHMWLFQTLP